MRTFVAVEIADEIREKIAPVQEDLRRTGAKVRWVDPGNMHLTLKFLGEIWEEKAKELCGCLRETAGQHAPLGLEFEGVGTFPPKGLPRVVWVGCGGAVDRLAALASAVESAAELIGVAKEKRPFKPHLTIGRVKVPPKAKQMMPRLERYAAKRFGAQTVSGFVLFQSELTREGAIYTPIEKFGLGG